MQQLFQIMQMQQFHPQFPQSQSMFPGMPPRFEMDQGVYPFQPFPGQFFPNPPAPTLPTSKKANLNQTNKSDGKEPTPDSSEKLRGEGSGKNKESQPKRKESLNENVANPSLFNQFSPMSNILTTPNMPNMSMPNLGNMPNSTASSLQAMPPIPGLNMQNLSLQNMGVLPNLPNFPNMAGMPNPNVPPQFNYYGPSANFFGQNPYLQPPNELEFGKSQGNYNFMPMGPGLNPPQGQTQGKNQQHLAGNSEKGNRMNQNMSFFPTGFGMDFPQGDNKSNDMYNEKNLDSLKMPGMKDGSETIKGPKRVIFTFD